jgi:type II secretory pathway component PulF
MSDESSALLAPLSRDEAEEVALRVADLAGAGLPLAEGLESAAREVGSRRLARGLSALARAVRQGQPLEAALRQTAPAVPAALAALLSAAERSGHLGLVLEEWTEQRIAARFRWRQIAGALAYPAFCLAAAVAVLTLVGAYVLPQFRTIFREFGLRVSDQTLLLLAVADYIAPAVLSVVGVLVFLALALRLIGGTSGWYWACSQVPLIGKVWHWSSVVEALRVAALLIEQRLPLPSALSLAADGMTDQYVGGTLRSLARQAEAGLPLWSGMIRNRRLPLSLVPLMRLGEQTGQLADCMRSGAEMLERRIEQRGDLILVIVPPMVFVGLAIVVVGVVVALFTPVLTLLGALR